jgi:peptidoglycan/LPS O-acetylase OafA/YrhL
VAVADVTSARRAQETSPAPEPAEKASAPHLPYFPALDGVRGLAVLGVLLFHAGFPWMVGGYLGVSTFFTLSGFLITSLLLAERAAKGGVSLKAFWMRRFRRLMPAALACLVLALLFGVFIADAIQRESLGGDVIASLVYVANWRFIFTGQSYADLFAAGESPVLHFWSLAIEEQFYVLYPLLVALLVGVGALARRSQSDRRKFWFREVGRHYRQLVGMTLVLLIGGSLAITLFAGFSRDRIYLGTDTRASELLMGGLLAVLLFNAKVTGRLARRGFAQRVVVVLGLGALVGAIALWSNTPQDASWLYHGGFTAYAGISALLITAAILPAGPVAWLLALGPIRHLGRISYGVYLYHWPVFLALRQKAEIDEWRLLLIGGAITLVLAELSFHFLEMPIRRGRPLLHIRPIRLAPFAAVGIAVAAIVVSATAPPPKFNFGSTQDQLAALAAEAEALPSTTIDPAQLVPPAPRVAPFGDSTALQTGWGVASYLRESNKGAIVDGFTGLGCSVIRTDQRRTPGIGVESSDETCNDWEHVWKDKIDATHPDVAMVQVGQWEIVDRKLPGDDVWRSPGDPVYDDYLFSEMTQAIDVLSSDGGIVVWLTSPTPGPNSKQNTPGWDPAQRMRVFNDLVNKLPGARPGKVVVVDLAGWVARLSPEEDARIRPDGVHFSNEDGNDTTTEVARTYLVDAIIGAWSKQWRANRESELQAGPPVPIAMFGDDTAGRIGEGLASWSDRGRRLDVENAALSNCGLGEGGFRLDRNQRARVPDECTEPQRRYLNALYNSSAKVVVLHASMWDVTDRQLSNDPTWRAPGDPVYDAYLRDAIAKATDFLHQNGVEHVVWLLTPHIDLDREPGQPSKEYTASEQTRIDKLNDLILEVASTRAFVHVLDYARFARDWPGGEFDDTYRPDGVAPNEAGARSIADWLAPQLVEIAAQPPAQDPAPPPTPGP